MPIVPYVRGWAMRWVDEDWPGWVEVHIPLAGGATLSLVDKVPIFDGVGRIVPGVVFPVPVRVACDIIGWEPVPGGQRLAIVTLRHQVEDEAGANTFRVPHECVDVRP